jgi:hypothetical protein
MATPNEIRSAFIERSAPGSATRSADEFVLEQFDQNGLGEHPEFLRMLDAITSEEPNLAHCRQAKGKAYRLLRNAQAA